MIFKILGEILYIKNIKNLCLIYKLKKTQTWNGVLKWNVKDIHKDKKDVVDGKKMLNVILADSKCVLSVELWVIKGLLVEMLEMQNY